MPAVRGAAEHERPQHEDHAQDQNHIGYAAQRHHGGVAAAFEVEHVHGDATDHGEDAHPDRDDGQRFGGQAAPGPVAPAD
jgi:hypothetical protein